MKKSTLELMKEDELRSFASVVGADVESAEGRDDLISAILDRTNRTITVKAGGMKLDVKASSVTDLRVVELAGRADKGISELTALSKVLLGERQHARLIEHVTDDDGSVDGVLFAFIVGKVIEQVERKN